MSISGWKSAMEAEMFALSKNATWSLVTHPPGKTTIGCRWVYTVKYLLGGSIERLKARLVAKGYTQTYSVDYAETFSPVAKISSDRILISLATNLGWPLFQLDVKNAFLNGNLKEEVYMEQPPGFIAQGESGKVCKLHKAIYGLKQSPRAWFGKFSEVVLKFRLRRCHSNHFVFSHASDREKILLIVYVDDIIITSDDKQGIDVLKRYLQNSFKDGISMSQSKYVLDILEETGLLGSKPYEDQGEL